MTDIALITSALTGINSALTIAKSLKDTNFSIEAAAIKIQLAELMNSLADSKSQIANINLLLCEKNHQIDLLEKKLKEVLSNDKPQYKHGVYKFKDDVGNYCTRCWDDKMKKFRITRTIIPNQVQCPECKSNYSTLS